MTMCLLRGQVTPDLREMTGIVLESLERSLTTERREGEEVRGTMIGIGGQGGGMRRNLVMIVGRKRCSSITERTS